MDYEWDPDKAAINLAKHGVRFEIVADFEWQTAETRPDRRRNYGEPRLISTGIIANDIFVLVHTPRGRVTRIISLRPANRKERLRYATTPQVS